MKTCGGCGGPLCEWCGGCIAEGECDCPSIVYHPEEFFIDDSYTCKLCGYNTDSEEDFVEHILDAHETEARSSDAVSISTGAALGTEYSGLGRDEYWDVDSIALAEEFDAS